MWLKTHPMAFKKFYQHKNRRTVIFALSLVSPQELCCYFFSLFRETSQAEFGISSVSFRPTFASPSTIWSRSAGDILVQFVLAGDASENTQRERNCVRDEGICPGPAQPLFATLQMEIQGRPPHPLMLFHPCREAFRSSEMFFAPILD